MWKNLIFGLLFAFALFPSSVLAMDFDCKETQCVSDWEYVTEKPYFTGIITELNTTDSLTGKHVDEHGQHLYSQFLYADGNTSDWIGIEPDLDDPDSNEVLINTKTAKAVRFRIDNDEVLDGVIEAPQALKDFEFVGLTESIPKVLVSGQVFDGLNIISRESWGGFEKENSSLRLVASRSFLPNFSRFNSNDDPEVSQVIGFLDNKTLLWPRQYAKEIKMLVVHHTASTNEIDNPLQAIRNIHEFHANGKNWGDIGYHYVVAPDGQIFEGRAGGAGVIGGHSFDVNKVSIGISVMGNYEQDQVSTETMRSLAMLLEKLSNAYDLDPTSSVFYKDMTMPVISGHRDTGKTLCPGKNLYSRLPELRTWVENNMTLNPKSFSLESENNFEVQAVVDQTIRVNLKNLTTQNWSSSNTRLVPADNETQKLIGSNNSFKLTSSNVRTDQTGSFELNFKTPNVSGFKALRFKLEHNGTSFKEDLYINMIVKSKDLQFEFDSSSSKLSMKPGQNGSLNIELSNDSEIDFNSQNPVYLAVLNSDSSEEIIKIRSNKINLKAGKSTTLKLDINSPSKAGTYTQKIGLVSPELGVLDADSTNIIVNVAQPRISSRSQIMQYEYNYKVSVDVWSEIEVEVPNNTSSTWTKDEFKVGHVKDYNTFITVPKIRESVVRPGEVATVYFKLRTDTALPHMLMMRFVHDNSVIYSKFVRIYINQNGPKPTSADNKSALAPSTKTSSPAKVASDNKTQATSTKKQLVTGLAAGLDSVEPTLRVHITGASLDSYSITCNTDFISNLGGLQKHQSGSVLHMNILQANQDIARFEPEADGICTVLNLERRPAWNPRLNDNSFRGNLEIRFDEGKAILINEIKLEQYLKGLGEVSESSDLDKAKTIMTAARSYAYHYAVDAEKFPGKPYNLNDDPNSTQKYIGYGMELRSPTISKAVMQTSGMVVQYQNETIKVPYFNQSAGFTKSAKDVWGWNSTPYLNGVADPYCLATSFLGHGVGISGCGATQMAKEGFDFDEIIKYYLPGVEIKKIY